jgi:hypothetical protein
MRRTDSTETAPPPAHPFLFSTMSKSTALAGEPPLIGARFFRVNRLFSKPLNSHRHFHTAVAAGQKARCKRAQRKNAFALAEASAQSATTGLQI